MIKTGSVILKITYWERYRTGDIYAKNYIATYTKNYSQGQIYE